MNRRQFIGGIGVGMVLTSGCLGSGGDTTTPVPGANQDGPADGTQTPEQSSGGQSTPESTPEPTVEPDVEETPEPAPEDRIDFTREEGDPEVVGTLLTKGPVPGVIVSSDLPFANAWQNYAEVDEENGQYLVGLSVTSGSSIGRLSVVGRVFDESGSLISKDTDVSNNIPGGEKALIHLAFDGDVTEMYHFEIDLTAPK
ncbi:MULTISPECIES: hypothetical protein [Haloferax]|uniref:Uncharacterized protein n=2 Tax=Haloferax TaxID=2251 RepID=A0A6G1Z6G6_9EURY|nr:MULTISPECIES: hypothetical protein [Haloferax]KAB1185051.1 hypothetical protein Hfx1149_16135 [Haloferax sp. CBA1149]MRW82227.1 hypothetical protein [Haloferax marinisediminis]